MTGTTANDVSTSTCIRFDSNKGKEKHKEVRFDHILKKPSGQGLGTPFRFDILAQLANIPARITIHELLRLSKETREVLRDALADSESFLIYMPEIPKDDAQSPCPECHHVQSKVPAITFTAEDMLADVLRWSITNRPLKIMLSTLTR